MDIKTLRVRLEMTQQEFGDAIGVTRARVAQLEAGEARAGIDTGWNIRDLARSHGMEVTLEDVLPRNAM